MPVTKDMLVSELQNLLRLTAFEQTIATIRRTQARTAALEAELAANVGKARERAALLAAAISQVGGTPDVVGSALGKLGAFTTSQFNQVQTLQGALLGDLSLEHELRERARYARTLAESLNEQQVVPVLERLETAHSATIEWLETRLDEVGRTGTSLLRATPVQAVVGGVRTLAAAPLNVVAGTVNQASALIWRLTPQQVQDLLSSAAATADGVLDQGVHAVRSVAQRTGDIAVAAGTGAEALVNDASESIVDATSSVTEVVGNRMDEAEALAGDAVKTVRDAAGRAASTVTDAATVAAGTAGDAASDVSEAVIDAASDVSGTVSDAASDAAGTVTDAASDAAGTVADAAGAVAETADTTVADLAEEAKDAAEELEEIDRNASGDIVSPFAGYERLSGDRIMGHIRDSEDVTELEQILAFEAAHKARKGVLAAVQERLDALSNNA